MELFLFVKCKSQYENDNKILKGVAAKKKQATIATELGVTSSTISRKNNRMEAREINIPNKSNINSKKSEEYKKLKKAAKKEYNLDLDGEKNVSTES